MHQMPILAKNFFFFISLLIFSFCNPLSVYQPTQPHLLHFSYRQSSFKGFHGHPCFIYSYNKYQPLRTFAFNIRYQTRVLCISLTSWLVLCLLTSPPLTSGDFRHIFLSHMFKIVPFFLVTHQFFHKRTTKIAVRTRVYDSKIIQGVSVGNVNILGNDTIEH